MFQKKLLEAVGLVNPCNMQKPFYSSGFDSLFGLAKCLLCEIVVIEIQIIPVCFFPR